MNSVHIGRSEMKINIHDGYGELELLKGSYEGGVHPFRCVLKAGACVTKPADPFTLHIVCLTDGKGAVLTPGEVFAVNEVSFFVPDPREGYTIHAASDMEYTTFVVEQTESDRARFDSFHMKVPFFKRLKDCTEYCQDVHTGTSRSWSVIPTKRLCRVLMGVVSADTTGKDAAEGCVEKGHPAVAQWNVIFGDSDMTVSIADETFDAAGGDFSYVKAGLDHSLLCKPGKKCSYIWFEHYVQEKNYLVSYPQA